MSRPLLRWFACALLAAVALPLPAAEPHGPALNPVDLRCDYLVNPLGIDDRQPALSWKLAGGAAGRRGLSQSAYQVLVAGEPSLLAQERADLWDSGRVESPQSIHVAYRGKPLTARRQCWWKVRFWDEAGQASAWSEPAFWSMGLLKHQRLARGQVDRLGPGRAARAARYQRPGRGQMALVSGRKRGHQCADGNPLFPPLLLAAGRSAGAAGGRDVRRRRSLHALRQWSSSRHRPWTPQPGRGRNHRTAAPGANLLSAEVANLPAPVVQNPGGWIGLVRVDFQEGPPLIITTDQSWKCAKTAGEGWQQTAFNDSDWTGARELGPLGMPPWGTPWKEADFEGDHRRLPARYLRREFQVAEGKTVRRATAYVSRPRLLRPYVNGRLIGDQLMNPAPDRLRPPRSVRHFRRHPADSMPGDNAIGVVLGNGRFFAPRRRIPVPMNTYGFPKLIAQLRLEYADGSEQDVVSDPSGELTSRGADPREQRIRRRGVRRPPRDARLVAPRLRRFPLATGRARRAARRELEAQMIEPIRVMQELKPVAHRQAEAGHLHGRFRPGVLRRRCGSRSPARPGRGSACAPVQRACPTGTLNSPTTAAP